MHCPKCKSELVKGILSDMLLTKHCQECAGEWIPGHNYQTWRSNSPTVPFDPDVISKNYHIHYTPSPLDGKTVPCPECGRILSRGKIPLKEPFYLEQCLSCRGIWCDRGEWEILEQLNLDKNIHHIFSNSWQSHIRATHQNELERQAVIEKVGTEMANRVFELADILAKHPNGDFAAAYLLRRFEREKS